MCAAPSLANEIREGAHGGRPRLAASQMTLEHYGSRHLSLLLRLRRLKQSAAASVFQSGVCWVEVWRK